MFHTASLHRAAHRRGNFFLRDNSCALDARFAKWGAGLSGREKASTVFRISQHKGISEEGRSVCKADNSVSAFDLNGASRDREGAHDDLQDALNGASTSSNGARAPVRGHAAAPFGLDLGTAAVSKEGGLFSANEASDVSLDELLQTITYLEQREHSVREQTKDILKVLRGAARSLAAHKASQDLVEGVNELERAFSSEDGSSRSVSGAPEIQEISPVERTIEHPGLLCNTRTGVSIDETRKRATISVQTSVSCEGDECYADMLHLDDYVAVASQVLAKSANRLVGRLADRIPGVDEDHTETHTKYHYILKNGTIISARPTEHPSKYFHPSYFVTLRHPETEQEIEAIFKPAVEGDGDGWHRPVMEWVAYELNRMLGMDYVPPVAYRTGGVDVDYQHFEEGAFILFVEGCRELREAPSGTRGIPLERLLSDTRVLDTLLHNSDRHHGHFLHGEHWCIQGQEGQPLHRPVLIDHAAGFRQEALVTMEHENAFQTGPVKRISARTYLRLRFLDAKGIAEHFRGVLTEKEMVDLLARRNQILAYLDKLVETEGYAATVTEFPYMPPAL